MGATINDVARLAGVSIGTVSRVINRHANVGARYRALVDDAIRELDYRPNVRAQQFVRDASRIVSFILANRTFYHPIHPRILQGAADHCEQAGYSVLFTRFGYSADAKPSDLELPQALAGYGAADSVILAGLNYANILESLKSARTPHVTLRNSLASGVDVEPYDVVRIDDCTAATEAVRYLISLGHRRILFIGDISLPWYETRYQGYLRAMREADLAPLAQTRALSDDLFGDGQQSAAHVLDQGERFTALFAGLDAIAYGAIETLRSRGLEVPRDVSVIGFGDQYGGSRLPALTTVHMDVDEVGRQLARMAIRKIEDPGRPIAEIVLTCRLILRGTCRPAPPDAG